MFKKIAFQALTKDRFRLVAAPIRTIYLAKKTATTNFYRYPMFTHTDSCNHGKDHHHSN